MFALLPQISYAQERQGNSPSSTALRSVRVFRVIRVFRDFDDALRSFPDKYIVAYEKEAKQGLGVEIYRKIFIIATGSDMSWRAVV